MKKRTYEDFIKNFSYYIPSGMDTREGTMAHLIMSVTAMSMAQLQEELMQLEKDAYGSTASGEYLDKTVEIIGLKRLDKVKAVVKIEPSEGLLVGDILTGGELKYTVTEVYDEYCLAECSSAGSVGNGYIGEVLCERDGAMGEIKITSIVVLGCDEEDDESLRKRYKEKIFCPVCTGNVSYYKDAIHSLIGVGGIKIEPAHKGAGTVKVIITNSEYQEAGEDLIKYVKEYLDPEEFSGLGYGVVPIGHSVEVESVEKVDIYIKMILNGGEAPATYMTVARSRIIGAIGQLNKDWDSQDNIVIWNRLIEDAAFAANDGIRDVKVVSINDETSRFILGKNQIVGDVYVYEA